MPGSPISSKNRIIHLNIDPELGGHGVFYTLEDGSEGSFPADYVLYFCDPTYHWSAIQQIKRALRGKLSASGLSVRVMADALMTSPAQVVRLLKDEKDSKQLRQIIQLAELAGYHLQLVPKKKTAA